MAASPNREVEETTRSGTAIPSRQRRIGGGWALRLVDTLHRWAESGWARSALVAWATLNGSVVPGPSDAMLVPLGLANPKASFEYAGWTILGAMIGGCIAFVIGAFFHQSIGIPVLTFLGVTDDQLAQVEQLFAERGWIVVALGALPFGSPKLVSIAAGAFGVPFGLFLLALLTMRATRFLVVGALLFFAGSRLTAYFERRLGRPLFATRD